MEERQLVLNSAAAATSTVGKYKIGDISSAGSTILGIIDQGASHTIYINSGHRLAWEISNASKNAKSAMNECQQLLQAAEAELLRMHISKAQNMLAASLSAAFRSDSEADVTALFGDARKFIEDKKEYRRTQVKSVVASNSRFEILFRTDGELSWWHATTNDPSMTRASAEYSRLSSIANTTLPKAYQAHAKQQLAAALHAGYSSATPEEAAAAFVSAGTFINSRATALARLHYVVDSALLGLLSIVAIMAAHKFLLTPSDLNDHLALGSVAGIAGALLSILHRSAKLRIDPMLPITSVVLQSCSKLLVGAISGLFVIGASKSNLVLGTISTNPFGLAVFALISGFSERFLPDLMESISTSARSTES